MNQACTARQIAGAVCMAASPGEILYSQAFGVRDLASSVPMTADTVFEIASMTKALVSTGCMQLVERGLLDLDVDVGNYVADFKNPLVLEGFDSAGVPRLRAAKRPVTLRHLLSNTSGITHEIWDSLRRQWLNKFGIRAFGREARRVPLCYDPGEGWSYGLGLDWVGECMEAVTGKPLEQYMQEHLFFPLEMTSTSWHPEESLSARRAAIHIRNDHGVLTSNTVLKRTLYGFEGTYDYSTGEGNGGLYSTAGDYIRFLQMILNRGSLEGVTCLSPASVEEMRQGQTGGLFMEFPAPLNPAAFGSDLTWLLGKDQKAQWGLGWMVNLKETASGRAPGGMAWFGGLDTYMWADPGSGLCGVFLLQMKPAALPETLELVHAFERMLHGRLDS